MKQRRPAARNGIMRALLPQRDEDFLVQGERIYYNHRYHSALLLRPAFELISALMVIVWIRLDVSLMRTASMTMCAVLAAVYLAKRARSLRWSLNKLVVVAGALIGAAILVEATTDTIAAFIILFFIARFVTRFVKWAWYRRLLVTDRRVIEVSGLVGSQIATMPLFRITDALLKRSAAAELLGYAEFRIESAGQNQALGRIPFLDHADFFQNLIVELSTTAKSDVPNSADDLGSMMDRML